MELPIYSVSGQETGRKATLSDSVFNIEPNAHVMYLDVKLLNARQRQGTAKTKERSEVRGSTRKLYRQKGTGNARQGAIRAPHHRHGGTVFGPKPRDYDFKLNKKVRQLARRSALSVKTRENEIIVVENFVFDQPKTKKFIQLVSALKLDGKKSLFVTSTYDKNLFLAGRNLDKTFVVHASQVTTKQILHADRVVILQDAIAVIESNLLPN
jgi:large subunit ribosomal protein L4